MSEKRFADFIVEDDASRLIESMSAEERRPKYGLNSLPETSGSFTAEERALAFETFSTRKKISPEKEI
jgi:hypothetical protein